MAARGGKILISAAPRGRFIQGVISGTPKPGVCLSISSVFTMGGWHTWVPFSASSGHKRLVAVLLEDELRGGALDEAYVSGSIVPIYIPLPGDELNMLLADVGGTGDTHAVLEQLMIETATGKLIADSSGESEPFTLLEAQAALTADTLAPCVFTGQ